MSMSVANSSTYLNEGAHTGRGGSSGFWGNRSGLEKKLLIGCAFLAIATFSLVVALAVVGSKKKDEPSVPVTTEKIPGTPEPPEVCNSKECQEAAKYLLMNMNRSADPCENFHEFVCGKWVQDNPIPDDKGSYGVFENLRSDLADTCIDALGKPEAFDHPNGAIDNARAFYQGCLTTENVDKASGVSQLKSILDDVDVSSDMNTVNTTLDVYKVLPNIIKNFGLNFIINFGIGADDMNNVQNVISLDQPSSFGLGLNFLVNGTGVEDRVDAYKTFITDSICLFNAVDPCPDISAVVENIFNFEVDMAKLCRPPVERRDASSWYFPMSISKLDASVPEMNILRFIQDILGDDAVTDETVIIVKEETYLKKVSELLKKTDNSTISNYLAWRLTESLGPALFKDMRTIKLKFDEVNGGVKKAIREEERCFDMTNIYFGHAVGRLYVDKKFERSSKNDVEEMVHFLANAFRELVSENQWMDEETKKKSLEKLEKMTSFIGYPDWTKDDGDLNEHYQLPAMNKTDFFASFQDAMNFTISRAFKQLTTPNNRTEAWITPASIVNAFYNPSANSITFPAGILQVPFYGKRLKALNYGAIGYVIGHEITHGYDDQGSQYDGNGDLRNWWTNATKKNFNEGKQCFIDQYSSIFDELSGLYLNGAQTIGENIADNGGIREAFKAYYLSGRDEDRLPGLEELTDSQLFYIAAGSVWCTKFRRAEMINQINQGVHSPGMYRAYVPLANSEDFAKAFSCPEGSKMNPKKRCTIW